MSASRQCVHCGAPVIGTVEGVKPTICCVTCCEMVKLPYSKFYRGCFGVSSSNAQRGYGCSIRDLRKLNCKTVSCDDRNTMRLYIAAEAEYLGRQKCGRSLADAQSRKAKVNCMVEKRKRREKDYSDSPVDFYPDGPFYNQKRIKRVHRPGEEIKEGAMGVRVIALHVNLKRTLSSIDPVLRRFLLGDFLTKSESIYKMEDIKKRYAVLERVERILHECKGAHPDAAFSFCVDYPNGGPAEFQELKEKIQTVFRLQGHRIFHFASNMDEKSAAQKSYTGKVNDSMLAIDHIEEYLLLFFDKDTVTNVLKGATWTDLSRLERPGRTLELVNRWTAKEKRAQKLQSALYDLGCSICCNCCDRNNFVRKPETTTLLKEVGILELRSVLDEEGVCGYGVDVGKRKFIQALEMHLPYQQAMDKAIAAALRHYEYCFCLF